jgi:hypothetical protein
MGKLDELEEQLLREKEELERKAAVKAGKAAMKSAWRGLVAAVSGAAESLVSSAERELEEARVARGEAPAGGEVLDDEVDDFTASQRALDNVRGSIASAGPSARELREAREALARAELEALKARFGDEQPAEEEPAEPVVEARYEGPGAQARRAREAREERAQRELERLKAQSEQPEDRPPVKRTL